MKKIVKLTCCNQCPHFVTEIFDDVGIGDDIEKCRKMNKDISSMKDFNNYKTLNTSNSFPTWCPLETVKDKNNG